MSADPAVSSTSPSPDVCLLLRAHAEQRWLSREVVPVLRQLETPDSLPKEQLGAALAYLEVIWVEALRNAEETDASHTELLKLSGGDQALLSKACGYQASVQRLRKVVAKHVERLIATPEDISLQAPAWR